MNDNFKEWLVDEAIWGARRLRRSLTGTVSQDVVNAVAADYAQQLGVPFSGEVGTALQQIAQARLVGGQENLITKRSVAAVMDAMGNKVQAPNNTPWSMLQGLRDNVARQQQVPILQPGPPGQKGTWQLESGFSDWDEEVAKAGGYPQWRKLSQYGNQQRMAKSKHARDAARMGISPEALTQQRLAVMAQAGGNQVTAGAKAMSKRRRNSVIKNLQSQLSSITDPATQQILQLLIKQLQTI